MKRNPIKLISAKAVNGGKVSLEFTQVVNTNDAAPSLTSLLNADDERFNVSKPRHAWITGSPALVQSLFGIDVSGLAVGETLELDMEEPTIDGEQLNIQLSETTKGSTWDLANLEKSAKRAGKDGEFIMTEDGQHIFSRADVVKGEAKHSKIAKTIRQATVVDASSEVANALGE